ncbi:hypothetical protein [Candidatus Contubernalis alkaliaceticus]|uniref:hypothetical protein n=1 Tax=Candidatus Contubernalis alkaliaceticus TaxID=338645 RepID=UPI001F4BD15F|nr:hypothetical protein [Candidatus Contubernalis alkalaceticus]UNC93175.1 hypothetical protein HUE98_14400 [Candidatus Contubernalis alkalaceticus]
MLIESLIRLGRPMILGGLTPGEIILQVSDIHSDKAKGFFEHIFIVEKLKDEIAVHPTATWRNFEEIKGKRSSKQKFIPDVDKAIAAPFVMPSGGNPTKPQGVYGFPVYIIYDRQIKEFFESQENIYSFLTGRLAKTLEADFGPEIVEKIAAGVHHEASKLNLNDKRKHMGLLILVDLEKESLYRLEKKGEILKDLNYSLLASSLLEEEKNIYVNLNKLKDLLWLAKAEEGSGKGKKEAGGICFFCPYGGMVISAYNKAYPWLTTTWKAPLPHGKSDDQLVEGIALCPECYGALTYGANIFDKLTKTLDNWLTKELFAPGTSPKGREYFRKSDKIYGSMLALPVLDGFLEEEFDREEFVRGISTMMAVDDSDKDKVKRYLGAVTGIESYLPEGFENDNYRLLLLYHTGDLSRGDPHLLACIEDVLPSTVKALRDISFEVAGYASEIYSSLPYQVSEKKLAYVNKKYSSLLFLLSMAYGYPYLWSSLEKAFHRNSLSEKRFLINAASRFNELSKNVDQNIYQIQEESIFYLSFKYFIKIYSKNLNKYSGGEGMRDWKELLGIIDENSLEGMEFQDVEEIGFVTGCLIRRFSNQYYQETKTGERGKDFIKHRLMTFGSSLTPEVIWKRALSRIEEYARLLDMKISKDLLQKVGVMSMLYMKNREDIAKKKDEFMAAFWSGYALYSWDKKKEGNNTSEEVS